MESAAAVARLQPNCIFLYSSRHEASFLHKPPPSFFSRYESLPSFSLKLQKDSPFADSSIRVGSLEKCNATLSDSSIISTSSSCKGAIRGRNMCFCRANDKNGEEVRAKGKGSGTTARGRRLLKIREDKRKREFDRLHNYPAWANFNPVDSYIWFELYSSPSDKDVNLIGSCFYPELSQFVEIMIQLANSSTEYNFLYDADEGFKVLPSSFHDIGDFELQDNWGRVWVDLGTADFFAIDVLLNCLTVLSSEYLGIQQVVFGGQRMGEWEEGMTSLEYGYKFFKICNVAK
ncbi:hypothetical protein Ancab_016145 [Ancistrocladus abbreviatus]